MGTREELQTLLKDLIGSGEVYNQPPSKLSYPCILYEHSNSDTKSADNYPYIYQKRWTISYIDRDPDSPIPDKIAKLQACVFDRHYIADNLHHFVFVMYF